MIAVGEMEVAISGLKTIYAAVIHQSTACDAYIIHFNTDIPQTVFRNLTFAAFSGRDLITASKLYEDEAHSLAGEATVGQPANQVLVLKDLSTLIETACA